MRGRLITVSGVDCAGKSTQIERLADALRSRGEEPVVVWFRPGYSRDLDRIRALVRRVRPSTLPTASRDDRARAQAFARPSVQRAWIAMALLDTLVQYAARVRGLIAAGRTVICDRYLADARLDLELRFPERRPDFAPFLTPTGWLCPRPDVQLLLLLPYEEMLRRSHAKQEPFPDSPEVRDRRFDAYVELGRSGSFVNVDSARPIAEVHDEIMGAVSRSTGRAPQRTSRRPPLR